jgi:hypothetical protein
MAPSLLFIRTHLLYIRQPFWRFRVELRACHIPNVLESHLSATVKFGRC